MKKLFDTIKRHNYRIVDINQDNYRKYYKDYKKVYEEKFKRPLTIEGYKARIQDNVINKIYYHKDIPVGIVLINLMEEHSRELTTYYNLSNIAYVTSLASTLKGVGRVIMEVINEIYRYKNLVLKPSDDALIQYYNNLGYIDFYPKTEELPSVMMVKPTPDRYVVVFGENHKLSEEVEHIRNSIDILEPDIVIHELDWEEKELSKRYKIVALEPSNRGNRELLNDLVDSFTIREKEMVDTIKSYTRKYNRIAIVVGDTHIRSAKREFKHTILTDYLHSIDAILIRSREPEIE